MEFTYLEEKETGQLALWTVRLTPDQVDMNSNPWHWAGAMGELLWYRPSYIDTLGMIMSCLI